MDIMAILSILISFSAVFSFINYRYFRLPRTIGLMLFAMGLSIALIVIGRTGWDFREQAAVLIERIDFNRLLLQGMLAFLLFAGALHVEANELLQHKWIIFSLATAGTILSAVLIGSLSWVIFQLLDPKIPLIYCMLFGALISPTDPVAVLGIIKELKVPKSIETQMAGEALFNDGVGVVLFIVLMRIAAGDPGTSVGKSLLLFIEEAFGGILIGLVVGWIAYQMLKRVDNYQVEVLITLGLVMGGYDLAHSLQTSGPLAIVTAGLLIGNQGRAFAMSDTTRQNLDTFWELIDEILNAVLFILIGIEVLVLEIRLHYLLAGIVIIPLVLSVRLVSVGIPFGLLGKHFPFRKNAVKTLTWGGLRGGIAVALVLSLPQGPYRGIIVLITYMVVTFSIIIQGLTIKKFLKRWGS